MTTREEKAAPATSKDGPDSKSEGTVVTFYSYKGGVGRSMVLANIAWLLASKYGKSVILIDWDLEAPGLHRFFKIADDKLDVGVIDYVTSYRDALKEVDRPVSKTDILLTKKYFHNIRTFPNGGSLRLMSAGRLHDRADYARKVRMFDWRDFYDNWSGGQLIEAMRAQLRNEAAFTLIDSRTGLTDIGGVCTVHLPDIVVFVFAYNGQNIDGVERIAAELSDPNNPTLAALQRGPTLHFMPSRKELTGDPRRQRDWEAEAEKKFSPFCGPQIKEKFENVINYLRKLAVPYVPYFAYGEEIAVRDDRGLEIREALEPLIELLLREDVESAIATAARNAQASRAPIQRTASAVAGAAGFIGLAALIAALSGVAPFADPKAVANPSALQTVLTMVVGALSGTAGALAAFLLQFQRFLQETADWENLYAWLRAAGWGAVGALAGGAYAGFADWNSWLPPISFGAGFMATAVVEGIVEIIHQRITHALGAQAPILNNLLARTIQGSHLAANSMSLGA